MLVAIQQGRGDSYYGVFCGKGPVEDAYTVVFVVGEKIVDKSRNVDRSVIAKWVRENRNNPDRRDISVDVHKTVGATMKV